MTKTTQKFKTCGPISSNLVGYSHQTMYTTKPPEIKYRNVLDTTATIFREEGMAGFFAGLKMRMVIQSVSSAIAWGTYQVIKSTLS
jgi:hypothetical protein